MSLEPTTPTPKSPSANTMKLDVVLSKIYKQRDKTLRRRSSTHAPEPEPPHPVKIEAGEMGQNGGQTRHFMQGTGHEVNQILTYVNPYEEQCYYNSSQMPPQNQPEPEPEPPHPVKIEAGEMGQNGGQTRHFMQGTGHEVNQILTYANPYEEQCYYSSSQMPLQNQLPQPRTETVPTPQEHDQFALQRNTQFPVLDPSILKSLPTPHQSIPHIGNAFGGQGLDKFDIMNGTVGNSSFDAGNNIDFGNVPGLDSAIDFHNVPGFNSTEYGNLGLYWMINYGNNAAPMSSNMNGNNGRSLLNNTRQL